MRDFNTSPVTICTTTPAVRQGAARASLVVYRYRMGQPQFLLIAARRNSSKLTLPGGKIDRYEKPLQAAIRETLEEAGVQTEQHTPLSSYLHRKSGGRVHPTTTFLAHYAGYLGRHEPRALHWFTPGQVADAAHLIRRPIRQQIEQAIDRLPVYA